MLESFHHNRILEQRPPQRMGAQLIGMLNADEVARQSYVVEIELGCFDQALSYVGKKRRKLEHHVAGFQDGQPMARSGVRNSGIRAQCGDVDKLTDPSGAQTDESTEAGKIADLADAAHIALDIGFEIIAKSLPGFEFLIVNPGIATGVQEIVHSVARPRLSQLSQSEGKQAEQCCTSGQGLADGMGEFELFATR